MLWWDFIMPVRVCFLGYKNYPIGDDYILQKVPCLNSLKYRIICLKQLLDCFLWFFLIICVFFSFYQLALIITQSINVQSFSFSLLLNEKIFKISAVYKLKNELKKIFPLYKKKLRIYLSLHYFTKIYLLASFHLLSL